MINPYVMTEMDWCDTTSLLLSSVISPPRWEPSTGWKFWARQVVQFPVVAQNVPPSPDNFDDWKEWATRFNLALESLI